MTVGYHNPYLADSQNPIAHGRCDQQDCTTIAGALPSGGPHAGEALASEDVQHTWLGPGHFGGLISGVYPDGRRVIWSNGRERLVKLDYDTLEVLATLDVGGGEPSTREDWEAGVAGLDDLSGDEAVGHAVDLASRFMTGLDGVYALLDVNQTLFLGRKTCAVAYAEVDPSDRGSAIVEVARWEKPPEVEGFFVGVNITPDGRLVLSTDHGWLVSLARDFSDHVAIRIPGAAEQAAGHCAHMEAERGNTAYGWVRTSMCTDGEGGIYISSVDHTHRVVWTGERLSTDPADGAWSAEYRNGAGTGSGTTPSLMGFGDDEDRFVVIGDGDDVFDIAAVGLGDVVEGDQHEWCVLGERAGRAGYCSCRMTAGSCLAATRAGSQVAAAERAGASSRAISSQLTSKRLCPMDPLNPVPIRYPDAYPMAPPASPTSRALPRNSTSTSRLPSPMARRIPISDRLCLALPTASSTIQAKLPTTASGTSTLAWSFRLSIIC